MGEEAKKVGEWLKRTRAKRLGRQDQTLKDLDRKKDGEAISRPRPVHEKS